VAPVQKIFSNSPRGRTRPDSGNLTTKEIVGRLKGDCWEAPGGEPAVCQQGNMTVRGITAVDSLSRDHKGDRGDA